MLFGKILSIPDETADNIRLCSPPISGDFLFARMLATDATTVFTWAISGQKSIEYQKSQ